jgi:hypothetical protein
VSRPLEDFAEKGLSPELQKLKYEYCENKRQGRPADQESIYKYETVRNKSKEESKKSINDIPRRWFPRH